MISRFRFCTRCSPVDTYNIMIPSSSFMTDDLKEVEGSLGELTPAVSSLVDADALKSLFSRTKKKAKSVTVTTLPPPPPPPVPKVASSESASDEGWEREFQKLQVFLNSHGLKIERIDADGSCLFSSFARHFTHSDGFLMSASEMRGRAVQYMTANPDAYSPFVDTDAYPNGFSDYCNRMLKPSTWGSQLEIQALSQSLGVNVYVFQTGGKATVKMVNFDECSAQCVTVSYHDGEHYNTVVQVDLEKPALTVTELENMLKGPEEAKAYIDSNLSKPTRKKKTGLFN